MIEVEKVTSQKIATLKKKLLSWGRANPASFPWRKNNKPFHSLIVEILLQRTRAEQVVPVFRQFKKQYPSPYSLSLAQTEIIEKLIYPLGLRWRAGNITKLGKELYAKYNGVPSLNMDELLQLPGVGPYAAGAYLSLHRGVRAIIPDANMARILGRVFGFDLHPEIRRDGKFLMLCDKVTPVRKFKEFNYAIIDHGREVCLPGKPKCQVCSLNNICTFYKNYKNKEN